MLGAGALFLVSHVSVWLRRLGSSPVPPVVLLVVLVVGLVALVAARRRACRRALRRRTRVALVPTEQFSPDVEMVLRFAAGLGRARRTLGARLFAPASAVRVLLDTDEAGRMRYTLAVPEHAARALRTAVGAFGQHVELVVPIGDGDRVKDDALEDVARAELVLARPSAEPLRDLGVDPTR